MIADNKEARLTDRAKLRIATAEETFEEQRRTFWGDLSRWEGIAPENIRAKIDAIFTL